MRVGLVLRHLLAVLLLPGMVVGAVPAWIRTALRAGDSRWPADSWQSALAHVASLALFAVGLVLVIWCVSLFARVGQGTRAPWDPTSRLVARGPYRHVRNPMISGVVLLLAGQALWIGSWKLAVWLTLVLVVNHLYFLGVEEPGLAARFGDSYRDYAANVPRWIPRRTPWMG